MPELPEVETVRRGVARYLPGERLEDVAFRRRDLRWPIPIRKVRGLRGRRCAGIERRAKYLMLRFDGPREPVAIVHLGMSGRLFVDVLRRASAVAEYAGTHTGRSALNAAPEWELHEHWRMRFGRHLVRFVDARRFGMLDVADARSLADHWLIRDLGPEPLGDEFTAGYLFRRTRRRKVATKTLLMDAREVVGVGNIYASEACFRARVRPGRRAAGLTRADCERLVDAVRAVLTDAIEAGGTTLRDYIGVDQGAGFFQQELRVYDREGQPCATCRTPIKRKMIGQRSTFYCPRCQR